MKNTSKEYTRLTKLNPNPEWGHAAIVLRLAIDRCEWSERSTARRCGMPVARLRELLNGAFLYDSDARMLAEGFSGYMDAGTLEFWTQANTSNKPLPYNVPKGAYRRQFICTIDGKGWSSVYAATYQGAVAEFARMHNLRNPFVLACFGVGSMGSEESAQLFRAETNQKIKVDVSAVEEE